MNRQPYSKPDQHWSPQLSPWLWKLFRPWRRRKLRYEQGVASVEVHGVEHVRQLLAEGAGVLITPNHCSHADGYVLHEMADAIPSPLYSMAAWQVFQRRGRFGRRLMQGVGCFSVDREGVDLRAFREAVDILATKPYPLAIFPEGEVYHINQRVMPFREGPASIALAAARKADRPIYCVAMGVKYEYVDSPLPALTELMGRLEQTLHWRPRPDMALRDRIYHLAEGLLALKEVEYLGATSAGPLAVRIVRFREHLLESLQRKHSIAAAALSVPERVKALRRCVIEKLESATAAERVELANDLDDLFLVVQCFSYPGDYVDEHPSIERMAETLDKLEEDLLRAPTAAVRGSRRAVVALGEPLLVSSGAARKTAAPDLTRAMEGRVQELLNGLFGLTGSATSREAAG